MASSRVKMARLVPVAFNNSYLGAIYSVSHAVLLPNSNVSTKILSGRAK